MTEETDLEALIRREFPSREHGLYVNHAAMGPWPRSVADAVIDFAEENARQGPAAYRDWIARERTLRERLARLINASGPDDIALCKNTTEGISLVAYGLDWAPGDTAVIPAGEFASNRLPWLAQADRGVAVREVDVRDAVDAEQALIDALDPSTRVLSVSAVQWNDGFRLDLVRLGQACRERGVLFFVDAIQQLGALPVDVIACHADFLAADAHKWLLGPEGIAVFYSRPESRPRLRLLQQGWHMVDNPWAFGRGEWTPSDSARRFEAGSPNSMGQVALDRSLALFETVGMETIARRVTANTACLIDRLGRLDGVELVSRTEPERRSAIVTFRAADVPAVRLHKALQEAGVETSVRHPGIRLSPHFYQDKADMDRLVAAIEAGVSGTG